MTFVSGAVADRLERLGAMGVGPVNRKTVRARVVGWFASSKHRQNWRFYTAVHVIRSSSDSRRPINEKCCATGTAE